MPTLCVDDKACQIRTFILGILLGGVEEEFLEASTIRKLRDAGENCRQGKFDSLDKEKNIFLKVPGDLGTRGGGGSPPLANWRRKCLPQNLGPPQAGLPTFMSTTPACLPSFYLKQYCLILLSNISRGYTACLPTFYVGYTACVPKIYVGYQA